MLGYIFCLKIMLCFSLCRRARNVFSSLYVINRWSGWLWNRGRGGSFGALFGRTLSTFSWVHIKLQLRKFPLGYMKIFWIPASNLWGKTWKMLHWNIDDCPVAARSYGNYANKNPNIYKPICMQGLYICIWFSLYLFSPQIW